MKSSNKIVGGVLGGFAEYFQVDSVWFRLGFLLFAFTIDFGSALLVYVIAMVVMPTADVNHISSEASYDNRKIEFGEVFANRQVITILGLGLILIGIVFLLEQIYHVPIWHTFNIYYYRVKQYIWPVLLILIGVWILYRVGKKNNG